MTTSPLNNMEVVWHSGDINVGWPQSLSDSDPTGHTTDLTKREYEGLMILCMVKSISGDPQGSHNVDLATDWKVWRVTFWWSCCWVTPQVNVGWRLPFGLVCNWTRSPYWLFKKLCIPQFCGQVWFSVTSGVLIDFQSLVSKMLVCPWNFHTGLAIFPQESCREASAPRSR